MCLNMALNKNAAVKLIQNNSRILLAHSLTVSSAVSFLPPAATSVLLSLSESHTQARLSVLGSMEGQTPEGSLLCRDNALTSAAELPVPLGALQYASDDGPVRHIKPSHGNHTEGDASFYKPHPVKFS